MNSVRSVKILVLLLAVLSIALFVSRPAELARLRCSDGSALTIYAATLGTNHVWRGHDSEWRSAKPCMALWGVWDGTSDKIHRFRFALVHEDVGKEWSRLEPQIEAFGPGRKTGVLASTTNAPWMSMRVRVLELTEDTLRRPTAEFKIKNSELINAERSKRYSKLRARLNLSPRRWRLGQDLLIANARTSNEMLVEHDYHFGPIIVYRKFD